MLVVMLAATAAAVVAVSGPHAPPALEVWVERSTVQVFEEDVRGQGSSSAQGVDWAAQRGEAEHVQLAARWTGAGPLNVTVGFNGRGSGVAGAAALVPATSADATLPPSWLSARHVGQVWVNATFTASPRGAGWWPDPLLPITGMQLEPNRTAAVWLTVAVPVSAAPGRYAGAVTVSSDLTDAVPYASVVATVPISLAVWNLTLTPLAASSFSTFFQFQYQAHPFGADRPEQIRGNLEPYYTNRTDAVKQAFFDMLCRSRMPPIGYGWLRPLDDMVGAIDSSRCTGTVPPEPAAAHGGALSVGASQSRPAPTADPEHHRRPQELARAQAGALLQKPALPFQPTAPRGATTPGIFFSIMSVSDLFGHVNPKPYNATYFALLWAVLDPVVAELNRTGALEHASVYGFDEAHPKAAYEPLVAQLFGAVRARYGGRLATVATLHYCPSMDSPIDVLVQSYAAWPNGTGAPPPPGPSQPGQYCPPGFPSRWEASAPGRRRYFFYHCFSPRSPDDADRPWTAKYGAMNTFVDYPRAHPRLMPWWAAANEGVSGWLYFEVSEWRFATNRTTKQPRPYQNHSMPMPPLPPFVRQPNDGFLEERVGGGFSGGSRLTFNVNKYYGNVYGGGTTAGDGVFVYPGVDGPVASARAEGWRDGSEDAELFSRLPAAARAKLIRRVVRGVGEWEADPALLEQTRRDAAAEVMRLASAAAMK